MINLDVSKVKSTVVTMGGVSETITVDTVWVDYMELSRNGSVRLVIRFGTKDEQGTLIETDTPITASISPDGVFSSNDPKYSGSVDVVALTQNVALALKGFEQAMVTEGLAVGTVV